MNPHRQPRPASPMSRASALDSRLSTLNSSRGFTLIEILVVIGIIALLMGLLVPAVMSAISTARDAEVRVEISKLGDGISSFKAKFGGIAPPSSITLAEKSTDWKAADRAIIRRLWPQFNFSLDRDLDGDGKKTKTLALSGEECLVFFLGGVTKSGKLVGFSKNPANPFDTTGGSRDGPFFEFNPARLTKGNVYSVYLDPLPSQTSPYVYFNSRKGRGYKNSDSARSNFYAQTGGNVAFKLNSHQIISPGADGLYGDPNVAATAVSFPGGVYDPDDESTVGEAERDNITNFTNGRLVP